MRLITSDALPHFSLVAIDGVGGTRLATGHDTPGSSADIETVSLPLGSGHLALATRARMC